MCESIILEECELVIVVVVGWLVLSENNVGWLVREIYSIQKECDNYSESNRNSGFMQVSNLKWLLYRLTNKKKNEMSCQHLDLLIQSMNRNIIGSIDGGWYLFDFDDMRSDCMDEEDQDDDRSGDRYFFHSKKENSEWLILCVCVFCSFLSSGLELLWYVSEWFFEESDLREISFYFWFRLF